MHKPVRKLLLLFFLTAAFLPASDLQAVVVAGEQHPSFVGYVPDEIVVHFDPTVSGQMKPDLMRKGRAGIARLDRLAVKHRVKSMVRQFPRFRKRMHRGRKIDLSGWHKIRFRKRVNIAKVVKTYKKINGVTDAQPIGIHRVDRTANDPLFSSQWHLPVINAPAAWDFETGRPEIVVAILDTGVRWFHRDIGGSNASYPGPPGPLEDLNGADGNLWINTVELNGTMDADEDGNGLNDDIIGWDFVDTLDCNTDDDCCDAGGQDCLVADNDPRDFNGHGTHVAGIVGALNNNGYAVSSAAGGWGNGTPQPAGNGVKIMALRIGYHGSDGRGYVRMDYAAQALAYATDKEVRMVNCSWHSSNTGGLGAALTAFTDAGGLVFKAAGNGYNDSPDYMGNRPDVISVASTTSSDCKSLFSDYGNWIDISAPGSGILSTAHNRSDPENESPPTVSLSGTSMASPVALSVAALIWSQNPAWTADQVKQKLFDTADAIDGLICNLAYAGKLGAGRVNAYLAVGSCEGDLNGNGVVDGRDLADLIDQFDCTGGCSLDTTYDDAVNAADLDVFAKDFTRVDCPQ